MTTLQTYTTIDDYIADLPLETQAILRKIQKLAHQYMPSGATEAMRYGVPTIQVDGKNILHFAAFKNHVSTYLASDELIEKYPELMPYRTGKGTLQFRLDTKIPYELITKFLIYQSENL